MLARGRVLRPIVHQEGLAQLAPCQRYLDPRPVDGLRPGGARVPSMREARGVANGQIGQERVVLKGREMRQELGLQVCAEGAVIGIKGVDGMGVAPLWIHQDDNPMSAAMW